MRFYCKSEKALHWKVTHTEVEFQIKIESYKLNEENNT